MLFLTLAISVCFLSSPLFSFQPYKTYLPTPQQEIGLNQKSNSVLFFDSSTTMYGQMAHETFLDDLRKREPLSALYFNKSDFRLSTMFENCYAPTNTETYNPYIRVLRISPRVSFSEIGSLVTLRAEAGLGKKKWLHVGVRGSLAFKRREIIRNDSGSRGPAERQDLVSQAEVRFVDGEDAVAVPDAQAFRLDFIEALPTFDSGDFQSSIKYNLDESGQMSIFLQPVHNDGGTIGVGFLAKKETYVPKTNDIAIGVAGFGTTGSQVNAELPENITNLQEGFRYELPDGKDYTKFLDSVEKTVQKRIADQDAKAQIWLIPAYDTGEISDPASEIKLAILDRINQYNENVYEWFHDREYELASQLCQGIGDAKLETYLAADLFDSFQIRLLAGAIVPTARQKTTGKSPYAIHLGNRGHVEFFVGGGMTLAIPHTHWFITSDAQYTTALSATEYICATPQGAQVKNMGPETRADISWHSTEGSVWLHMQHPSTNSITFAFGYEWYSKMEDTLMYLDTVESFLGKSFNSTTRAYDISNTMTLDPEVAKKHTGAISHTLRASTTYIASPYVKMYAATGYVIGGRNTPQTLELAAGCTISF